MNLTDLREELEQHTLDLRADPARITVGVAGRVRTTKRRRTVAGAAAACALVATAGAGLWTAANPTGPAPVPAASGPTETVGEDGLPSRHVPDAPGDVAKDGLRFRSQVGADTLAVGFIGDPGQSQFTLAWEPTTAHVSIASECYLPGADTAEAQALMLRVSLEGTEGYFSGMCQAGLPEGRDLPATGVIPGEPGEGWSELAVGSGARLRVQLVETKSGKPTSFEGVRIVAAVYDLGDQRVITDDAGKALVAIPEVLEHQGHDYVIEGLVSGPLGKGPLPQITTPADKPFLVAWGSGGTPVPDSNAGADVGYLRLTGLDEDSSGIEGGGWSTVPQRARTAGTVTLTLEGPRPSSGTAFIAVYVPTP